MSHHRFHVGQLVRVHGDNALRTSGIYEITRCLPAANDGAAQYRVKGAHEPHERLVTEQQLTPAVQPRA